MKKLISLILVFSLMCSCSITVSLADLSEIASIFEKVQWGDSEDTVSKLLRQGQFVRFNDNWTSIGDIHDKFYRDDAYYVMYFTNDKLCLIDILLDNDTDYYRILTNQYGSPIRTSGNPSNGEYKEDPQGDKYFWQDGNATGIYLAKSYNSIKISYIDLNADLTYTFNTKPAEKEELLFRKIPWKTDLPSVIESITETTFNEPYDDYAISTSKRCLDNGDFWGSGLGISISSRKPINVAGYTASISLGFAYKPKSDGLLTRKNEDTAFTYATYSIQHKDARFAISDLSQKLTDLYGEPKHINTNVVIEYDIYYWEGANDTIISLIGEFFDTGSTYINIVYSFYGADDLYMAAKDAIALEERITTNKEDYSGL